MKPQIILKCCNANCISYYKEIELLEKEKTSIYISKFCKICHHEGILRIYHKSIESANIDSFYAIVSGMAKEFHLLKKIVSKGVADAEDIVRYEEILEQIRELECHHCQKKFIDHEH